MLRRGLWWGWLGTGMLAMIAGACSQPGSLLLPSPIAQEGERAFTLTPDSSPVKVSFLSGQLQDLQVVERIDRATGRIVDPPWLRGTLRLTNGSTGHAVRLIAGRIEYVGPEGEPILPLRERRDTSFLFDTSVTDRLDPHMETYQALEVPFPAEALKANQLRQIRLELNFETLPYREGGVTLPLSLVR